jgi:hypothetical protein
MVHSYQLCFNDVEKRLQNQRVGAAGYVKRESVLLMIDGQ